MANESQNQERFGFWRLFKPDRATLRCRLDMDGQLVRVNRAVCDLLNCSPEDLLGTSILDFVVPAERGDLRALLAELQIGQWRRHVAVSVLPQDRVALMVWWNTLVQDEGENLFYDCVGEAALVGNRRMLTELPEAERFFAMTVADFLRAGGAVAPDEPEG